PATGPSTTRCPIFTTSWVVIAALLGLPPGLEDAINDPTGRLSGADRHVLGERVEKLRAEDHIDVPVVLIGDLGAETLEDTARTAFTALRSTASWDARALLVVGLDGRAVVELGEHPGPAWTPAEAAAIVAEVRAPAGDREALVKAIEQALDAL